MRKGKGGGRLGGLEDFSSPRKHPFLRRRFKIKTWYCDHLPRFLTYYLLWNEKRESLNVPVAEDVGHWNTAVRDKRLTPPGRCWMYDESNVLWTPRAVAGHFILPMISSCGHRQAGRDSRWPVSLCSAALHRGTTVGQKLIRAPRLFFFFSSWTVLNRLGAISGNGLRSVTQTEWSGGSGPHTLKYTHLHTIIHNVHTHTHTLYLNIAQ